MSSFGSSNYMTFPSALASFKINLLQGKSKLRLIHFRQPKCFGKCWSSFTGCKSCHSEMRFSETQGAYYWKISWYSVAKCRRHTSPPAEQLGCSSARGTGGKKLLGLFKVDSRQVTNVTMFFKFSPGLVSILMQHTGMFFFKFSPDLVLFVM